MEVISFISFSYLDISGFPQQTSLTYKLCKKKREKERKLLKDTYLLTNAKCSF